MSSKSDIKALATAVCNIEKRLVVIERHQRLIEQRLGIDAEPDISQPWDIWDSSRTTNAGKTSITAEIETLQQVPAGECLSFTVEGVRWALRRANEQPGWAMRAADRWFTDRAGSRMELVRIIGEEWHGSKPA